jgi:hypothetical protein
MDNIPTLAWWSAVLWILGFLPKKQHVFCSPEAVSACAVSPWTIFQLLLTSGGGDPEIMVVSSSLDTRPPAKEARARFLLPKESRQERGHQFLPPRNQTKRRL